MLTDFIHRSVSIPVFMWPSGDRALVVLTSPRGERDVRVVTMVRGDRGWEIPSCPDNKLASESGCLTAPERISGKRPKYPKRARRKSVSGYVVIQYSILKDGTTADQLLITCSAPGFGLEDAAASAIEKWRYVPAKCKGAPVCTRATAVVEFEPRSR